MSEITIREKIEQKILASNGNTKKAAIDICVLLDEEIGLVGNGWFDDDKEIHDLICDG